MTDESLDPAGTPTIAVVGASDSGKSQRQIQRESVGGDRTRSWRFCRPPLSHLATTLWRPLPGREPVSAAVDSAACAYTIEGMRRPYGDSNPSFRLERPAALAS